MSNIVDTLVDLSGLPGTTDSNGSDFDLLREAVLIAGLDGALSDPAASLTVFAPNDAAFVGLAQTLGFGGSDEGGALGHIVDALTLLGGGDPIPLLQSVLEYHVVVDGAFDFATLSGFGDGAMVDTLQGGNVTLNLAAPGLGDLDPGLPDPGLIGFDIDGGNGFIHVLNGVLLPVAVSSILSQPGTDFIIGDDDGASYNAEDGNDFVDGNGGKDVIRVGSGNDVAIGGTENDWISGGGGTDTLLGEEGRDKILGGSGDDVINGGIGNDILIGGRGGDTFVFEEMSGHDTIIRFENGRDKIDVSDFEITTLEEIGVKGGSFRTTIEFDEDATVSLLGTWKSQIDESDFIFA